jgi:predicted amidohydrolase YtcJ
MAADLVLIDGDIEEIPAEKIGGTGIALTVAGGRVTHDAGILAVQAA